MSRRLREEILGSIIELLEEGPKTAMELQESLQIPRRTLFRYLGILRDNGVVISLGKGRGYCLNDPEAVRRFFMKPFSVGEIFPVLSACGMFVEGAIGCPSKRARTTLAIKTLNILLHTLEIIFIQTILSASARRDVDDMERAIAYLAEAVSKLAWMSINLLAMPRTVKPRKMLEALSKKIVRKAFREVNSYAETVKRVASHFPKTSRYSSKA